MMPQLRFATVRDLFDSFPTAEQDVGHEPTGERCIAFLEALVAKGASEKAVSFCVYLLPRREAVWWGCETLRRLKPDQSPADQRSLEVTETWAYQPHEAHRLAALAAGLEGDGRSPATWMARAAGWSGGNIVAPELGKAPAPQDQTARALRAGILIAMALAPKDNLPSVMRACLQDGIGLAIGRRAIPSPEE